MNIILFDIDGTLLRAGTAPLLAFNQAFFELYGVEDASAGVEVHGRTDRWIAQQVCRARLGREVAEPELCALCDLYVERYRTTSAGTDGFTLLPGAAALVALLSEREGTLLGVQTGNLEEAAGIKLRHAGLHDYFRFGGYGSDHHEREEIIKAALERAAAIDPTPATNVIVIGDTIHDVSAGKAVGAVTVAVATGRCTMAELKDSGADILLATLEETAPLLNIFS